MGSACSILPPILNTTRPFQPNELRTVRTSVVFLTSTIAPPYAHDDLQLQPQPTEPERPHGRKKVNPREQIPKSKINIKDLKNNTLSLTMKS